MVQELMVFEEPVVLVEILCQFMLKSVLTQFLEQGLSLILNKYRFLVRYRSLSSDNFLDCHLILCVFSHQNFQQLY